MSVSTELHRVPRTPSFLQISTADEGIARLRGVRLEEKVRTRNRPFVYAASAFRNRCCVDH